MSVDCRILRRAVHALAPPLLLPLLLAHCAEPPVGAAPPRPPPPAAAPAAPVAPPAAGPTADAAPEVETRTWPPVPPLETAAQKDKLAFLSTLCRPAVKHDRTGALHVGCATCPSFDSKEARPNGHVEVDPEMFYELTILLPGSFTKPGADEASATFDGCESHAENYGGTLLAERRGSDWVETRYDSGVHPDACKTFRRKDGRDILVCQWGDGHQSYWHEMVFSYDFSRGTPDDVAKGWDEIVTMNDDATAGCFGALPGAPIQSGRVDAFKLKDVNNDGELDLLVTVSIAKSLPTKAYKDKCAELIAEMEKDTSAPVDVAAALGKRRTYELEFVYNGQTFVPTPRAARRQKAL